MSSPQVAFKHYKSAQRTQSSACTAQRTQDLTARLDRGDTGLTQRSDTARTLQAQRTQSSAYTAQRTQRSENGEARATVL